MAKATNIEVGQTYRAIDDERFTWRVKRLLVDGVHAALVRVDDPSRQKTISIWALSNSRLYTAVEPPHGA
jgi:hypothetical protein